MCFTNIINNKPYKNLEDAYNKIGKKYFNKKVGESLIKAGAFDFEDKNRNKMLNKFIEIRKATKKEDLYNEDEYNKDICMDYEIEKLGSSITYKSIWDTIGEKEYLDIKIKIDFTKKFVAFLTKLNIFVAQYKTLTKIQKT